MDDKEQKEHAFSEQVSGEVVKNIDAITAIFDKSQVGKCGGKCQGFKEENLLDLCPQCLRALEEESKEIFSVSPELRLLGDVMNSRD
jgi:hypothetical protein